MIRARAVFVTLLLVGPLLGAACSSSSKSDAQGGDGGSSESGGGTSGKAGHAGSVGEGGRLGTAASAGDGDSAGAQSDSGAAGSAGSAGSGGTPVDPCAACPSGLCLPGTTECVACLPENDKCPDGQYCSASNTCVSGCKDDASCASGVCGADHDCQSCLSDQECSAPHLCGANQCAAPCTADQEGAGAGCSAGLSCCSLHCVDAKTDSQHCGTCGTACASGQFCGISGCQSSTVAAACSVAKVTVLLDGSDGNQTPARNIARALLATCTPAPAVREVSQDVADAVNATTGRPVAGGDELLISAGGSYYSRLTSYVSTQPVAPIYGILNGANLEYRKRSTDAVVVSNPFGGAHDAQDAFVIQFMRDASSGTLILNAQGFWQAGTTAAAYYFINAMLPSLATQTKAWYVYQWTDANADLLPQLPEITLIDSGS